jgi:hypothetical protein
VKKLFEVTETYYVLAENRIKALYVCVNHDNVDRQIEQVENMDGINHSWRDRIPFSDDYSNDRICRQIMKEIGE